MTVQGGALQTAEKALNDDNRTRTRGHVDNTCFQVKNGNRKHF